MNYIKQLQTDKAEAIDTARTIETEINDLISYLCCDKFRVDTHVQVGATYCGHYYQSEIMFFT